jgi:hypothetical protein
MFRKHSEALGDVLERLELKADGRLHNVPEQSNCAHIVVSCHDPPPLFFYTSFLFGKFALENRRFYILDNSQAHVLTLLVENIMVLRSQHFCFGLA